MEKGRMNQHTYDVMKELAGALFYALLGQCDDQTERESIELLRAAVAADCVRHWETKAILSGIVRSSSQVPA
jgi:hypothetical protein